MFRGRYGVFVLSAIILLPGIFSAVGDIAKKKCHEYVQVFQKLSGKKFCPRRAVPLIIGGNPAALVEFPHMAAIGFGYAPDVELSWQCGGTLISEKFVLTAAHCLKSRDNGPSQKVRLGDINMRNEIDAGSQEYFIFQRIPHPNYIHPLKYNDIALLKLHGRVLFNLHVRPACLHTNYKINSKKVIATGYGKQSYENRAGASSLMKVELSVLSNDACSHSFAPDIRRTNSVLKKGIAETQLCVGELAGGKDTCQGDSGGPIQIPVYWSPCTYYIVGVTSFGKFCGYPNAPSIYTRVSSYIGWIESIVWGKTHRDFIGSNKKYFMLM